MARLEKIKESRLGKLQEIKKLGVDPYPASSRRTHTIAQATASFGKKVAVVGRVWSIRSHGGSVFLDLRDETGDIQVFLARNKLSEKEFSVAKLLDSGDFVEVVGSVGKTHAGEITIFAAHLNLLAKSLRPLPASWSGFRDVEERYRQRYADLILNPGVKETLVVRTKLIRELRNHLDKHGFLEVETPILQPIYGGAVARPFVTHHHALDSDFYLRISDELYLKRLIVGGFEKVYEIGHDFRNEGIDRTHNPEFTQLEFYWAYKDYQDLMDFTQEMITEIVSQLRGTLEFSFQGQKLNLSLPWPRVTYHDTITEHTGIDIEIANTEKKLVSEIKKRKIKIDLSGISGFGLLMDELYKQTTRPKLVGPVFLVDRPVEFVALAKRKPDDPTKTASFQLLIAGSEVVNAYNELNDPIDQAKRWRESEKLARRKAAEHEAFDDDYIRALEYGMPPTAGWGMGIDRFVMLLTDQRNIKDVILFPTLRPKK